jgi:hypothetical protein
MFHFFFYLKKVLVVLENFINMCRAADTSSGFPLLQLSTRSCFHAKLLLANSNFLIPFLINRDQTFQGVTVFFTLLIKPAQKRNSEQPNTQDSTRNH